MTQQVKDFFSEYEKANSTSDFAAFEEIYADRFMFGGPNGVNVVDRDAFLKMLPKMKEQLSLLGLDTTEVQRVEAQALDSRYLLAKVGWRIAVRTSSDVTHLDALATFVLLRQPEGALRIVFQIDHQDLSAMVKDMHRGV